MSPRHSVESLRLLPVLTLAALLSACGNGQSQEAAAGGMSAQAVTVQTLAARDVAIDFEYPGQTAGSREVEIRARVSGIIDRRFYEEGSQVKAGAALFRIDPAPYAAAAAAAEANVATAQANLAKAERDHARYQPLIEARAISQMDFDNVASALDIARANLKAAQAQYNTARINLGYTEIHAPIPGVIGRALKVEGALASADSDSLLATMAQIDPIDVNFAVSDADRTKLQSEAQAGTLLLPAGNAGYSVRLKSNDGRWLAQAGKLNFSDYKADTNTGAYSTRARFNNPKGELTPGQFVRVVVSGVKRPNAIVVPQRAVLDGATGKYVYVVGKGQDGKPAAEPRPVVPGEWVQLEGAEGNGWVIKQGLKAGDQVVVDGTARIFFPFQPINPLTAEQAAAAAAAQPAARQ
ncbi:efflux RND transporter periplasmic adaptor subunit [Arenimonas sp.]|uniref:efflux RND transporter periplasmic adaptor subunit n=1 Tax=Arenimonas sp. TaxID=1872635 RepID=UPI0039E60021